MKKILQRLLLALFGLLCGVLVAEIAIRFIAPQPVFLTRAPNIFFIRHDPLLGWANREGAGGRYSPGPAIPETGIRINALGFRGQLPAPGKPARHRILFLGDSNTFGYGVEEEQRYSNLIASLSANRFEQVNLGVFAYGPDQEALLLEKQGLAFQPATIILGISAGDLSDIMYSINGGAAKPYFRLFGDRLMVQNEPVPDNAPYLKTGSVTKLNRALYEHVHLYRLLLFRKVFSSVYMQGVASVAEMDENEAFNVMVALISGMNQICRENNIRFIALLIPHGIWLEGMKRGEGVPGYYPLLKKRLSADGVLYLDSTQALLDAARRGEKPFFDKDPIHLTALGNRLIAEILLPRLMESSNVR
jgi:lysophospholipase L1-like esterase